MDQPAIVRPAMPTEAAEVARVCRAAFAPLVSGVGRKPGSMTADHAALVALGRAHVIVADAAVVAVLLVEPRDGDLLVRTLAVDPPHQGRGHGTRLLTAAEAQARAIGRTVLRLTVHSGWTRNIALYRRLGFTETAREADLVGERVFMEKRLAGPPA